MRQTTLITFSILRRHEEAAISALAPKLTGKVIDLGGDTRAAYRDLLSAVDSVTTVNLDPASKPDIFANLEEPLSVDSGSFDGALLINVLEHIYEAKQLLSETARVVRSGGWAVVVVPFLFPVHPSPKDFWRFTDASLNRMLTEAGFEEIEIKPLGTGVISARLVLIERLLPIWIQFITCRTLQPLAAGLDYLFAKFARVIGKAYRPSDYPLGYIVYAKRR